LLHASPWARPAAAATARRIAARATCGQRRRYPPEEIEMTAEDKLALCEKVIARWLEDELQGDTAMVSMTTILYPGLMSDEQVRWEATGPRPSPKALN
jgi:hypothetical protein